MHRFRFLASRDDDTWAILGRELHHLRKVVRLQVGDLVEVFDGAGHDGVGSIESIAKDKALVRAEQLFQHPKSSAPLVAVISALNPSKVCDYLPALVELGIDQVHIYRTEGGKKPAGESQHGPDGRVHAVIVEACKQSKRAWLPEHYHHSSLRTVLEATNRYSWRRLVLDPDGECPLSSDDLGPEGTLYVCASEKGFSTGESQLLNDVGFFSRSLGPHVLRASTAAISATAILAASRPQS